MGVGMEMEMGIETAAAQGKKPTWRDRKEAEKIIIIKY